MRPEYFRKWREENSDKIREYGCNRRAHGIIDKGIIKRIVNENIFKYGIITCEKCKKKCENNYHIDHIVPVSKEGTNNHENLQVLCAKCNREKHVNIIDYRKTGIDKQLFMQEV